MTRARRPAWRSRQHRRSVLVAVAAVLHDREHDQRPQCRSRRERGDPVRRRARRTDRCGRRRRHRRRSRVAHHLSPLGAWRPYRRGGVSVGESALDSTSWVVTRPSCATRSTERRPDDLDGASPRPDEAFFAARPRSRWKGAGWASPRAALPADDVAGLDDVGGFAGVALEPLLGVSDSPQSTGGRRIRIAFVAVPDTISEQSST
jgi:hypothetical protein